jgi:hypothetical protein
LIYSKEPLDGALALKDSEGKTALDQARTALQKSHDYHWAGEARELVKFLDEMILGGTSSQPSSLLGSWETGKVDTPR